MKFGEVSLGEAAGCILAHSAKLPDGTLRKGALLGAVELARLAAAGLGSVVVARLEDGDVPENEAAARVAAALAGGGVEVGNATTGRVNLYSRGEGLLQLDVRRIEAANAVHEGLTIATLPADSVVAAGQMLATIKIIPYAVPEAALASVVAALAADAPALSVARWSGIGVLLVLTRAADTPVAVLNKMRRAVAQRLEPLRARLLAEDVVAHDEQAIAALLGQLQDVAVRPDLILLSGIAATVDRSDVIPAAIVAAGGRVLHAGMPVDPGNLLLLAQLPLGAAACPVVGIPTCARSPKLNGFDYVLRRFAAGLPVTGAHLMRMGVGGLLTEIESRPMPRDGSSRD